MNDVLPDQIGYPESLLTTEYGVFEDRRADGLGFALIHTSRARVRADQVLCQAATYPRFLRVREVICRPWTRPIPPGEGE